MAIRLNDKENVEVEMKKKRESALQPVDTMHVNTVCTFNYIN